MKHRARRLSDTAPARLLGLSVALVGLLALLGAAAVSAAPPPADVILVLDNSGSMRKNDPEFLLKRAVAQFVSKLEQGTRVGMVVFDQGVRYPVALGDLNADTRTALQEALEQVDYRGQYTNSPGAIERAIYELKGGARDDVEKVIVFMTDGIVDTGDEAADRDKTAWMREELAADAADNDIRIFGIAFTENADFFLIQSLAKKTDGEYFRALTPDALAGVFDTVQTKLAEPPAAPPPPPSPAVAMPAPAAASAPAGGSCLDTLVAEERAIMEETAAEAGITAEQLCREMLAAEPGTAVTVRPAPAASEDETLGLIVLIGAAAAVLLVIVVLVVLVLRRRKPGADAPPAPVAEAFLKDINGITGEPAVQLSAKPMMIGRVAGNDPDQLDYYVIDKGTIGRRHAIIQYHDYSYWLVDQGSVNGTFLNGERIDGERQLRHGDRIKLHKYEFEFSMPEMEDAGHTVFADPNDATMMGEATLIGSAADLAEDHRAVGSDDDDDDDVFDITGDHERDAPAPERAAAAADVDDFPDDDDEADTALSARAAAALEAEEETALPAAPPVTVADDNDEEAFDAEASAFFDEDDLGQTSQPQPAPADDFGDDLETVLPTAQESAPDDDAEEDFSESATLLPNAPYAEDALNETSDISIDDFMRTDSFEASEIAYDGDDADDSEDATLLPDHVQTHTSTPAIDDVFDITGDRTIPPVPADDDDDDDEPDPEAPTKFHS